MKLHVDGTPLSQRQLAALADVRCRRLSALEAGKVVPDTKTALRLSVALATFVERLFDDLYDEQRHKVYEAVRRSGWRLSFGSIEDRDDVSKIRQMRQRIDVDGKQMTQGQLAALIGCHRTHISRYETERRVPELKMLFRLAAALRTMAFVLVPQVHHDAVETVAKQMRRHRTYPQRYDKKTQQHQSTT